MSECVISISGLEIQATEVFGVPKLMLSKRPYPPILINVGDEWAGRALLDALAELTMTMGRCESCDE